MKGRKVRRQVKKKERMLRNKIREERRKKGLSPSVLCYTPRR
jgi:hypothetical protein